MDGVDTCHGVGSPHFDQWDRERDVSDGVTTLSAVWKNTPPASPLIDSVFPQLAAKHFSLTCFSLFCSLVTS